MKVWVALGCVREWATYGQASANTQVNSVVLVVTYDKRLRC